MPASLNSRVRTFEADVEKVHQLVHGAPGGSVPTESGLLRTFAELQASLIAQFDAAANRTEAVQSKQAAQQARSGAQTAQAASEAARDAAQLAAGIYPDTATGLAATPAGSYFSVPSESESEHLILYRNSAGSAVEIKRYPSSAALDGMRTLLAQLSADLIRTQTAIVQRLAFN